MNTEPVEPFGPIYPGNLGAGVQKHRRTAAKAGSVAAMSKAERRAYGEAVEQAVRSLQRQAMQRVVAAPYAGCASGTFHNNGDAIAAAVRGRQARENAAACRLDREGRSDELVRRLYDEAMAAKRGANAPQLEAAE
jgi:hypothetical protein